MSLFNPVVTIAPEVQAAQQVGAGGNRLFDLIRASYLRNYQTVWANPAATPDKIIAALGTQAAAVFTHAEALADLLNGIIAGTVPTGYPTGWTVTFNTDGSATASKTS